jgi:hypothetical protein
MTIVVACQFEDGAIIISDSRASYELPNGKLMPNDSLQKILPMGKNGIFCYAGSVSVANKVLQQLKLLNKNKRQYQYLDSIIKKLPGLLRYVFNSSSQQEKDGSLSLIVGGKLLSGEIKFCVLQSPNFNPSIIKDFDIIGSGSVIREYLEKEIKNILPLKDFKARFDSLRNCLESALPKYNVDSVGGMLQAIMICKDGIKPFFYGYIDLNPLSPPSSAQIEMENGVWTQHNQTTDEKTIIVTPGELLPKRVAEERFYDYKTPDNKKSPHWHLNYFITATDIKISTGNIEFNNPTTIVSSFNYPVLFDAMLGIGFWGTAGKENMIVSLEFDGKKQKVKDIPFDIPIFPEDIDLQESISFVVEKPGLYIIEIKIGEIVLARRAMFFNQILEDPRLYNDEVQFAIKINEQAFDNLVGSVDSSVEGGKTELVYFFLCEKCMENQSILSVHNQFWIAYWEKYPLPLHCYLATAFRLAKGNHSIRVDLVDAATRKSSEIDSVDIESRSSCLITPIHSKTIILIPKPGYYFINIYVDNKMVTSNILIAELSKAQFSFSLFQEQENEVKNGQLLLAPKRANFPK